MKMKKIAATLLAGVLGIGLLAGCGSGTSSSSAAPAGATEAVTAVETEESVEAVTESASEETTEDAVIRIGSLKGPTSMGLVAMMDQHPEYSYAMETAADAVTASLIKGDLDIALIPANLASVLYNKTNGAISVIDINTYSVLEFVSADESVASIKDLAGKTLYLTGKGTTPDIVLHYLLAENGMGEEDVTLEYKSEATEVVSALAEDKSAVGLLPQPFATAASIKNTDLQTVFYLGRAWMDVQMANGGDASLITGVTVVRNEFLQSNPELVKAFLEAHAESVEIVNADPATAAKKIVELGIVAKEAIAEAAIPHCAISCTTGDDMKTGLSGYLQVLYDQNPEAVGGALPGDDFYYIAE